MIKDLSGGRHPLGYLIEIQAIGNTAKASAVDPQTGLEASIVGPVSAGREILARNAVAKLERMLRRNADKSRRE